MLSLIAAASSTSADSTASQVSTILNAIAPYLWGAVVILAIVIFRKPLSSAIGRVSEVDVGSTKVVLQGQADTAASATKHALGGDHVTPPATSAISLAAQKVSSDPPGSVLDAWGVVEDAIRAPAAEQVPKGVLSPSVPEVVNGLAATKNLDPSLVPVATTLASLRQMAASSPKTISPATAKSFVAAAGDLAQLIAQAASPTGSQAG